MSESLKFVKIALLNLIYSRMRQGDLNFASQARNCRIGTKPRPFIPL